MKRWLSEAGTVALALVVALIVWANAEQESNPIFVMRGVSVSLRGMGAGLALRSLTAVSVDVHGRAPEDFWQTGRGADLEAYVDLTGLGTGKYQLDVQVASFQPEVQILEVTPPQVTVELERMKQKSVSVRAEVMDSAPFGYDWHTPEITPPEVQVSGPERYVDSVTTAVVEVYLRTARNAVERRLPVSLRGRDGQPVGNVVEWAPRMVTVTVQIEQRPGYRDVPVRVRWEGQPARGYRIREVAVDPSIVTLFGSPAAIEAVPGYVETAPVNIEGANGNIVERLALIVPENVSVFGAQSVVVSVGITPIEESTWVQRVPVIQGLDDRLQAELSPRLVEILVAGPLPRLETLQPGDVQILLDLTGLEAGTHTLEPSVILPEGIRQETLVPETIEVKITWSPTPTATVTPTVTGTATATATMTPTAIPTVRATRTPTPTASGGS
jgi:YbbR domain-containing protein